MYSMVMVRHLFILALGILTPCANVQCSASAKRSLFKYEVTEALAMKLADYGIGTCSRECSTNVHEIKIPSHFRGSLLVREKFHRG